MKTDQKSKESHILFGTQMQLYNGQRILINC